MLFDEFDRKKKHKLVSSLETMDAVQDHNENLDKVSPVGRHDAEVPSTSLISPYKFPNAASYPYTVNSPDGQSSPKRTKLEGGLAAVVDCGCCHHVPKRAPLYGCVKGHFVCADCKEKGGILLSCPTCFDHDLSFRLKEQEDLLFTEVCNFAVKGCADKISEEDRAYHEADCVYRIVQCPKRLFAKSCDYSDSLKNIRDHARTMHNYEKGFTVLDEFTITSKMMNTKDKYSLDNVYQDSARYPPIEMLFDEKLFYCYYERKHSRGLWFFFIRIYGSEVLASEYTAEIHVGPGDIDKGNLAGSERNYRGNVVPYLLLREEIHQSGLCLAVDDAGIRKFKRDNTMFRVWWKLAKKTTRKI